MKLHGVTPLHRVSFAPIKIILEEGNKKPKHTKEVYLKDSGIRTTKQIGDMAENLAASYLEGKGFTIIARNWKTKFCEIDIIARKGSVIYFVEVKYRKQSKWGDGLDAIGKVKLKKMKFAAEYYALKNKITSDDMRLSVVAISGSPAVVDSYLEI